MEAVMFMVDAICIVMLALAVTRSKRAGGKPSLGLFAYKDIVREKSPQRFADADSTSAEEPGNA